MPSFLELLQSSSGDEPPSSSGVVPLDVLASVKTEGGRRRRRRHRRNLACSGLALVALAVPALALVGGSDDPEDVRSTDVAGSTEPETEREGAVASSTSTTDPTEVAGVVIERTPEEAAAESGTTTTTTRPRATTTPTTPPTAPPPVCSNSYDPACGDFSWSPAPGANGSLTLTAPAGLSVTAGGSLPVTVEWSDPDAPLRFTDHNGDGSPLLSTSCTSERRYGPWAPPAAAGGSGSFEVTYIAPPTPGSYTFTVNASTLDAACEYDPYGSEASITIPVTVTAAEE